MPKTKSKIPPKSPTNEAVLLHAVLAQVPFEGWTEAALRNGAEASGLTPPVAQDIFPNVGAAVSAFSAWANQTMLARIAAEKLYDKMRVRDKVAYAVRARLEALTPHREAQRRLTLWYAMPHHAPLAVRNLATLCDAVWQAAGDTSRDYNFYTKRMLLSYVVKTTTLFWLSDDSPNAAATWDFLDRRIAEVLKLGKAAGSLGNLPEKLEKLSKVSAWAARWRSAAS
jgi:ubiquinone biosynthesis protein COQ9